MNISSKNRIIVINKNDYNYKLIALIIVFIITIINNTVLLTVNLTIIIIIFIVDIEIWSLFVIKEK